MLCTIGKFARTIHYYYANVLHENKNPKHGWWLNFLFLFCLLLSARYDKVLKNDTKMWKTLHFMRNLPTGKNADSVVRMLFLFRRLTVSDGLSCWCCSRLPPQHCRDSISMKRVDPLPPRTWPRIYQVCHDISRVLVTESLTGTAMMSRVQSYSDLWSKNSSHDNGCWRNLRNYLDFH